MEIFKNNWVEMLCILNITIITYGIYKRNKSIIAIEKEIQYYTNKASQRGQSCPPTFNDTAPLRISISAHFIKMDKEWIKNGYIGIIINAIIFAIKLVL